MKYGSSLVVTPLSIPSSATQGPNADLSSNEEFEEILKDSKDEPITKKRVSDSNEDDSGERETEAMGTCLLPLSDLFFFFFVTSWYTSLIVLHFNFLSHKYFRGA